MKKLTQEQIEQLFVFTKKHLVEHYDVQVELVDHLANAIEAEWEINPNISFTEALQKEYKNFGKIALPNILLYQIFLPFLAPLADLLLVVSLILSGLGIIVADPMHIIIYYLLFSLIDIAGAALAFAFEKEDFKKLIWMIPQRLVYRQLMYYILFKSINKAVKGEIQGWGVLKRTGNVTTN